MTTNDVKVVVGTQISFGDHAGDFVGGASKTSIEIGTPTDVQLSMTGVTTLAARESAKFDFGATRARSYSVVAAMEFATAPTTLQTMDFYLAPSPESVAANGNPQSIDGLDAAAPSGHSSLPELLAACMYIGSMVCSADATGTVQTGYVGTFSPPERYGILIVVNSTSVTLHSDDVECNVVFNPIIDQIQAAV